MAGPGLVQKFVQRSSVVADIVPPPIQVVTLIMLP